MKITRTLQDGFDLRAIETLDSEQPFPHGLDRLLVGTLSQRRTFSTVDFLKLNFDDFNVRGLYGPADEARFDGQFAMAAIDQYKQLNACWTAVIEQRVECRTDGAAV